MTLPSFSLDPAVTIKSEFRRCLELARERHRLGVDPISVVGELSDGVDEILRRLFRSFFEGAEDDVALVAVGGYGRRELCPYSDVDILVLRNPGAAPERIERFVRHLWDGGFELGHSVRTPAECLKFMIEDPVTAAALLESRLIVGSRKVYAKFEAAALGRYRKRRGERFAQIKLEQLRRSVEGPGRTIYVLEPHLKDGACGLRDIQRILWVERIRHGARSLDDLARSGDFAPESVAGLKMAYRFYLRLRCELHFANGLRQDILEPDSLVEIARGLGYQGSDIAAGEALMSDYYLHARHVYRFVRHYLETGTRGRRFLERLAYKLLGKDLGNGVFLYRGTLFLRGEPKFDDPAAGIAGVFVTVQKLDARPSETLCEWIRNRIEREDIDFARSTFAQRALVSILREGRNAGRILKAMHECGVLERIVPEFGDLTGLVRFDGHHQFTVDEHTLRTLEELDRLESESDLGEEEEETSPYRNEFRRVLREIPDRFPLRLALLLHDIGKAVPGKHAVSGGELAVLVCERLGLEAPVTEVVEFLVYRHLELFRISEHRDFTEEGIVEALARVIGSEERLRMLYLLTYIDILAVGPGTWTAWKGAQLAELYERTLACLRAGGIASPSIEEGLAASGLNPEEQRLVLEHLALLHSRAYEVEVVPERMLQHARMAERFRSQGRTQVAYERLSGCYEVTICARDRPRLFADLAGVLLSEGFNILGARIYSRSDGVALDVFHVEIADRVQRPAEERLRRVEEHLRRIEGRETTVDDLIRGRIRHYGVEMRRRFRKPLFGPSVAIDNECSETSTVIEVRGGDRPGLLYDLATALSNLRLDVRTAKVSTLADRAHDVFYVTEIDGLKATNPARLKEIELALVQAVEEPSPALKRELFKK